MQSNSKQNFGAETSAGKSSADAQSFTAEQAIANLRQREDLGARYYAAWWLGKFRVSEPEAIDALLMALEDEKDRAPDGGYPLRRNAARALGKLGDTRAVPPLIRCLEFPDFYVREAAAQALEMLGGAAAPALRDRRCVTALMQLLDGGVEAAKQVPGKPHLVQPYEAVIEALGTLGATEAIPQIKPFVEHPVAKVKYAAARAMYQLTGDSFYGEMLVQALREDDLQLRRSALMDLGAVGYLPAGEAIAETLAENSMKLIALKGLLEKEIALHFRESLILSEESIKVMKLMDSLL
ncbi:HEAT repeat domain-containing protein [Pleurocapsales cyanobacterium LEGE 06147]|nr:HEAT repeat domain-containing protein [Pleurocapsales cyanobacterium LEGE 06147]